MPLQNSFNLVYTSIREENTRVDKAKSVKSYHGQISEFGDGNGDPKFLFANEDTNKPKLLIKTFNNKDQVNNLRFLKTILDIGKNEFRFSPFAYAAPIGYGFFESEAQKVLEISGQGNVPFMVYVFNEESQDLQKIISQDNHNDIIIGKQKFNYLRSNSIALKLFNLYGLLENLQLQYHQCEQYQIIHYDIKAANYILDSNDNIFIVDLDQSGVYGRVKKVYVYKPFCDLTIYESSGVLLPYEISTEKESSTSQIDKELWNMKERYTEIWMAWSLIYRVLTGFQSPFFFLRTTNHENINHFIKSNNITDLFSKSTYLRGDSFDCYAKNDEQKKHEFINNISLHVDKAVSKDLRDMMNQVFIKGFYDFNLRPTFYKLSQEYNLLDK
jgi:hypothetical protein